MNSNELTAFETFSSYLKSYFFERDLKKTVKFLGDISGFGTGVDEVVPPADMRELFKRDIEQSPSKIIVKNDKFSHRLISDDVVIVWGTLDISSEIDGFPYEINNLRLSILLLRRNDSWKIEHKHISLPFIEQEEDEAYPLKKLEEQNAVLSELVEIRTSELKHKNEELRIANAEKDKLMSIVAHDLRSPFNAILGYSQILNEELAQSGKEEWAEYAENLDKTARDTYSLLENLLSWSRSHISGYEPAKEIVDFPQIAKITIDLASQLAQRKNIKIENRLPDKLSLNCDPFMIRTVLRNLLSNAIKFTEPGGKVILESEQVENGGVVFTISDDGVGIPEEKLDTLFVIDAKKSSKGTLGEEGTGLGLSLCNEFVSKHGGGIWVESTVGKGSTFKFSLSNQDVLSQ
ncbi:MAG: nuclear transport factor 2 family protein [Melioribacteraceae bacterium]|nr:nuclear transport factor 2 family protein [Melioribacteraceae bacterium]MCF8430320.1 nuclear transport factor 2 family protein [Melioribacteraceae bacterium]